ncbi:uncharacterized protein [Setaria viridis]|uniref:uncharacterized protein n=1 Tax=Setaria viridis TaxID=4556 RepID=UPI001493BFBD|nr:uncharacterized protein LOC117862584 [Setaria viridis]
MAADLGAEVSRLQSQMQGLETAVSQGVDRECLLRAQSEGLEGDLARLKDAIDAERAEHANLRDTVCIVCEDLSVVQEEGTSTLVARVLGTYQRAREIAQEALHVGVRRAFGVFGSHYSNINFDAMGGGTPPATLRPSWKRLMRRCLIQRRPWRSSWRMRPSHQRTQE